MSSATADLNAPDSPQTLTAVRCSDLLAVIVGNCTLYNADCLDVLPKISGVQLTVTSPPYNQKLDQIKASGFKKEGNAQWANRISSSYADSMDETEYQDWQVRVLNAIHAASTDDASCFYNHKCRWREKVLLHPIDTVRRSLWQLRQEIIWARDGSLTQNAKMFPPSEERIYWLKKDSWRWNEDANRWMSVWRLDSSKMTDHPVAYPVEIPQRAIMATTAEGETVLDPFMGSGTTGLACMKLNRKFVGIEKDPKHFATAVSRLEREANQGVLL